MLSGLDESSSIRSTPSQTKSRLIHTIQQKNLKGNIYNSVAPPSGYGLHPVFKTTIVRKKLQNNDNSDARSDVSGGLNYHYEDSVHDKLEHNESRLINVEMIMTEMKSEIDILKSEMREISRKFEKVSSPRVSSDTIKSPSSFDYTTTPQNNALSSTESPFVHFKKAAGNIQGSLWEMFFSIIQIFFLIIFYLVPLKIFKEQVLSFYQRITGRVLVIQEKEKQSPKKKSSMNQSRRATVT